MGRAARVVAVATALAMAAGACDSGGQSAGSTPPTAVTTPATSPTEPVGAGAAPRLFGLRLSAGSALPAATDSTPVVAGDDLPPDRVAEITGRLPAFDGGDATQVPFAWPPQSSPPPRPGSTVDVPFPPAQDTPPPKTPTGPLHVLRVQPEGEVPIAPYLSITFDQPMVPVGTVGQVDASAVPVTITPPIDGRWQWIGTRTLRFDAGSGDVDRLPMATTLHVEVPAGTTSATGGALAETKAFDVVTPPPTPQTLTPQGASLKLTQVFVAVFDQRVDPQAVLATIHLGVDGNDTRVRLATDEELAADDSASALAQQAGEGRWVAFRATDALPADSALRIDIGPGTPSAEGPGTSTTPTTYDQLRTYAPLRADGVLCMQGTQECPPGTQLVVQFNNTLDADRADLTNLRVDPPLAGMTTSVEGSALVISGDTRPRTSYRIELPGAMTDVFGQTLGAGQTVSAQISAAPAGIGQLGMISTLDPFADGQKLPVITTNEPKLRVRIFDGGQVTFADYVDYYQRHWDPREQVPPAWPVLSDDVIDSGAAADQAAATEIDLAGALHGRPGHVIVLVEPAGPAAGEGENPTALTWTQSTQLGVDTITTATEALVWTTELRTGAPRPGATVHLGGAQATTDADGLARLPLPASSDPATVMSATSGEDTTLLESWSTRQDVHDQLRWHLFTDRGVYRPGETLHAKGWIRRLSLTDDAQLAIVDPGATVRYVLHDAYGNDVASGSVELGRLGSFTIEAPISATANVGDGSLQLDVDGQPGVDNAETVQAVQIAEYRRPEFEVSTKPRTQPPFVSADPVTIDATAAYYAGGPLGGAPVDWRVSRSEATYSPPGWDGFTFGVWHPWWTDVYASGARQGAAGAAVDAAVPCCAPPEPIDVREFHGTTDAAGHHALQVDFEGDGGRLPDLPVSLSAEATVTDVNRQAWAARSTLLVHPADRYVGLRASRAFVRQGDEIDIETVLTGIDGTAVPGVPVTLTAGRVTHSGSGQTDETLVDTTDCTVTSAQSPVHCTFPTTIGGQYQVTAVVEGTHGGHSRSELRVWVSGGQSLPSRTVEAQQLTLVPDRQHYVAGDTAEVLVQAPFASGEGLATIARNGIRSTQRFTLRDGSAVLRVPIADGDVPQLSVTAEVAGTTTRTALDGTPQADAPPQPATAGGTVTLDVPPAGRTLDVAATPANAQVAPGGQTSVDVAVTDAAGAPVSGADVAVVVVDDAVLALSGYELADPLNSFYEQWHEQLSNASSRQQVSLRDLTKAEQGAPATTAVAGAGGAAAPTAERSAADSSTAAASQGQVDVRTDFEALALFEPSATTTADGHVVVPVTVPGNVTRYRVMAVAAAARDRFGKGESSITAGLPLMVRPSPPRFANFGDRFELPVVIQNQSDAALDVDVVLQAGNLIIDGTGGRRVHVPAEGRVEVRFPVATAQAGTASYRVAAVDAAGSDLGDAASAAFPVYTPATAEAFATYGVIDGDPVAQPLVAPTGVVAQYGGLEIDTSSTALQALTDAVLFISDYRYASSDALASRLIAFTSLGDVLAAFDAAGMPPAAQVAATIDDDLAALAGMQNDDGGFGWWSGGPSQPFDTVEVAHALLAAKAAGHGVPQGMLDRALAFLADIESHIPAEYGEPQRDSIRAYALWVRALGGERDPQKAAQLYRERGSELTVETLAWLWPSIDDPAIGAEIERTLANRVVETAGAANFTTNYGDGAYLIMQSDRRTDGIALDALITMRPQSDLIPKLVAGLLASRVAGRWNDIQENAFVLVALHRYFVTYEGQTPDFVARAWLGERFAGEHTFSGRQTDRARLTVPMADLQAAGDGDLVLAKDGSGRLYYRIGMRYAPADLTLDALDRGFTVARTYEAVDDQTDVHRADDGTWRIKAGARVRVALTMVAESQRTHVALVDPLPAGLESLNPDLAVTQTAPAPAGGDTGGPPRPLGPAAGAPPIGIAWLWGAWYEHQQLRDDRSEAFTTVLPAGTYTYSYVARATTPGEYVVPPARAEEMYAPETFGRSASDHVVVA